MINIGDRKGAILDKAIKDCNPKFAVELGAYCGYSAVRIARLLPEDGKLVSIEINPLFAAIATKVVEYAGLSHKVKIIVGAAEKVLPTLKNRFKINSLDFVFIDHWKDKYLPDLKVLESSRLLRKGTVIVADNVIFPGTPKYLAYIRNSPNYTTILKECPLGYNTSIQDGVEISTYQGDD